LAIIYNAASNTTMVSCLHNSSRRKAYPFSLCRVSNHALWHKN
jgi:hypothetical protein